MRLVCVSPIALMCFAIPSTGAAQPWLDAYRSGDYQRAANLLHPIVLDWSSQPISDDPAPARHLAMLYADGRGVVHDPIAACSLSQVAYGATMIRLAMTGVTSSTRSRYESFAPARRSMYGYRSGARSDPD
jgi:hypothetical protein